MLKPARSPRRTDPFGIAKTQVGDNDRSGMKDLTSPKLMWLKASLFVVIGLASAGMLLIQTPTFKTGLLLVLAIRAFCRAYYFAFYVLERYVDPHFRFAGLWSLVEYMLKNRRAP